MKIRFYGKVHELNKDTELYCGRCGSGHTVFGERCYFTRATEKHLIFTTESGAIVKTNMNMQTIGKARKNNYWVGFGDRTNQEYYINWPVSYWNDKKCCMEYK